MGSTGLIVFLLVLILIAVSRNRGGRTEGPLDSIFGLLMGMFAALAIVVLVVMLLVAIFSG